MALQGDRVAAKATLMADAGNAEELLDLLGLTPVDEFRPAAQADVPVLREFERLYAAERGEEDPETDIPALVAARLAFVIEVNGHVAGAVRSNLSDGRFVHAGGVFVHPRFRGRGIGARLLAALCERIHATGDAVVLDVDRSNEAAMRTYATAGFREVAAGTSLRFAEDAWRASG